MATATEMPVVSEATEIRCQEKTKGGLRYEVILAEPTAPAKRVPSPTQPAGPGSPTNGLSSSVEDKLRAAEERRLSREAEKMASLTAHHGKIEEAARKRDVLTTAFVTATRETLDKKLMSSEEKREAYIADLKNKIKDHLEGVEKSRQSLELQSEEIRSALEEKLKIAEAQREQNYKKMIDRLKEHEEHVDRVRHGLTERSEELEAKIQAKLEQAFERRKTIEREQLEKIRERAQRISIIRQSKAQSKSQSNEDGDGDVSVCQETAGSG